MIRCMLTSGINLKRIEKLKKWACYEPESFLGSSDEKILECMEYDKKILKDINDLYDYIVANGSALDLERTSFNFSFPICDFMRINKLANRISSFDISYYYDVKLSEEEKKYCFDFIRRCTFDNSHEIMKEAVNLDNKYLSDVIVYLLRNHPDAQYIGNEKNVQAHCISGFKSKKRTPFYRREKYK